ncbi:MAG TPA: MFS transporter [Ktedonobacterales bacterium]
MKIARITLPLAFFAFILIGANDGAVGVLLPSMRGFYQVDKATIGFLFLAGALGYLLASFNQGLLIEQLGNRLFLVVGASVFILGAGTLSLRPVFPVALVAVMLIGGGGAALDAGLNAYIAGLPRNASLLNYLHAFYGIGALIGPALASLILAASWTWNSVYIIWVSVGMVALVGFWFVFREPAFDENKKAAKEPGNVLALALRLRVVWIGALFLLFYVGSEVSLGSWSYTFLTEQRHLPTLFSGWAVSGYWFGLTVGRLTLARLAERGGGKRLIQGCLVGVAVGIVLIWFAPDGAVAAAGLWIAGFSLGPIFPTTIAIMSTLVPSRLLPSAIGFLASLGSMGAALFPWLAGNLAQQFGLWTLLPYIVVLSGVMLVLWLALRGRPAIAPSPEVKGS